jgi:hypothetical protein
MPKYVYVGQFGFCWRLTVEQWRALCEAGARGEGYNLEPYRELKRFPRGIWLDRETGRRSSTRNDILYYEPLDWEPDWFQSALEDLESS